MSYNPTRVNSNRAAVQRQQRFQPPPGAGISRSAIMARQGQYRVPAGDKIPTHTGHTVKLFDGAFITRFETMDARCTSGVQVNPEGDRSILMLRGALFVTVKDAEGPKSLKVIDGQHINIPRGVEFELATSGDFGADFHVTETADFDKTLQKLTPPIIGTAPPITDQSLQSSPTVVRRGVDPVTMAQAQDLAEASQERRRRRAAARTNGEFASNANSSSVIGVSPMPGGPPVEE